MEQSIYLSIFLASLVTYMCRALGVKLSNKINTESRFFDWIECISIGIIISVISKIIFFPEGLLEETLLSIRVFSILILIAVYFSFKKNILLAIVLSTIFFTSLHNFELFLFNF